VARRIVQAAHDIVAQTIAGDPDDEQVVRAFGKDKLDRNARIGAADDRRKQLLSRRGAAPRKQSDIIRVDIDAQACG
jgi:hypothetical protein